MVTETMGVSSTARLPSLGAQSIPPLFSHLQHTSNAKVVARWSITIRSFRAIPVPTNAWPPANEFDSSFSPIPSQAASVTAGQNTTSSSGSSAAAQYSGPTSSGGAGSSASGAPPLTKPRTMWQVQLSDHPGVLFVIVEDSGRSSRAKVWRDWELSTKQWKKQKRRENAARREKEQKAVRDKAQLELNAAVHSTTAAADLSEIKSNEQTEAQDHKHVAVKESAEPMDEDAPTSLITDGDAKTDSEFTFSQNTAGSQQVEAGIPALDTTVSMEQAITEPAGPRPKLQLPSHTRYTASAITSSMSAMLSSLNLPPPHGAPVGTAGPGAWVPRGAAVSIEGLVLEINSQSLNALPGISPSLASLSTTEDAALITSSTEAGAGGAGRGGADWRVRVGSVVGGGGRSAGAIIEAEFLPASTLLPTSKFMHDFLFSLFPPGFIPVPPPAASVPAAGIPNVTSLHGSAAASQTGSAVGTPRINNATLGTIPTSNGNALSTSAVTSGSGFSYTIGGSAGASAAPNRHLNIPVVSDQLWEEVVPQSGERWRRRVVKRSRQMTLTARAQRRQRKEGAKPSTAHNGRVAQDNSGSTDVFGWHTFGSDDEEDASTTAHMNGDWQDQDDSQVSSSDSETEPTLDSSSGAVTGAGGLTGTAVTMQQVDEADDDDDDDRPLGAPIWSNANRTPATSTTNPTAAPATPPGATKKEDTAQLIFQGLRPDEADSTAEDGWSGIERGRRIAFQYVQMLRAEGII